MQYSLPEVDRLMSRSQSIRDAIKGPDKSTGHSLCLVLLFTLSPNSLFLFSHTSVLSLSQTSSLLHSVFHTPHRLVLTRILAMAVNTVPFSDSFGSKEVTGGWVSPF